MRLARQREDDGTGFVLELSLAFLCLVAQKNRRDRSYDPQPSMRRWNAVLMFNFLLEARRDPSDSFFVSFKEQYENAHLTVIRPKSYIAPASRRPRDVIPSRRCQRYRRERSFGNHVIESFQDGGFNMAVFNLSFSFSGLVTAFLIEHDSSQLRELKTDISASRTKGPNFRTKKF